MRAQYPTPTPTPTRVGKGMHGREARKQTKHSCNPSKSTQCDLSQLQAFLAPPRSFAHRTLPNAVPGTVLGSGESKHEHSRISAPQSLQSSSGGTGKHIVGKHNQAWEMVAALGTFLEGLELGPAG